MNFGSIHRPARLAALAAALAVAAFATQARAADHITIGALKSTNVGAVYVALDKGYFAKEGLEVELVPFQSAEPIAVAAAGGSIDFGTTSTSAGLFSLAGQDELKIISGLYSEAPGFHNFAVAASIKAYDGGLKTYRDLPGHSVAVTQIGSPVHYSLALIAEKYHLDLTAIRILPLQSIPNMASALKGNQTDAVVINATSINPLLAAGQAKLLGWVGDETPWQTAVTFTTPKMIAAHKATVEAFLRALKQGARYYHDAFTGPGEKPLDGPTAPEVTAILAKHTGLTPAQVKASIAYVDREERVDVGDIAHQVEWFESQKMLKGQVKPDSVMDSSLVVPLPPR
ncbi:MAG TPA: ABC transporter substrate-binding protein [Stellaceae bacterium]|nr:ABC transporter substrate-binding protein [Stellaceae bacterium]